MGQVWFYDVAAGTVYDLDSSTSEVDPFTLTGTGAPDYCKFSEGSAHAVVGYNDQRFGSNSDVSVSVIDTSTWTETLYAPSIAGESAGMFAVSGSTLLYTARNGVSAPAVAIDLSSGVETAISATTSEWSFADGMGAVVEPSGDRYWIGLGDCGVAFDMATHTQAIDGCLESGDQIRAHFITMTPF